MLESATAVAPMGRGASQPRRVPSSPSPGGPVSPERGWPLRLGVLTAQIDPVLVEEVVAAEAGPVAWLLAPLAAGASLVLCRQPDPARLPRRAADERVTATLGRQIQGVRELGRPD